MYHFPPRSQPYGGVRTGDSTSASKSGIARRSVMGFAEGRNDNIYEISSSQDNEDGYLPLFIHTPTLSRRRAPAHFLVNTPIVNDRNLMRTGAVSGGGGCTGSMLKVHIRFFRSHASGMHPRYRDDRRPRLLPGQSFFGAGTTTRQPISYPPTMLESGIPFPGTG
jgi:hypothetical protein